MEAQVGQLQAQLVQDAARTPGILTLQVNSNASAAAAAATTTAPATTTAGSHSQMPKVNHRLARTSFQTSSTASRGATFGSGEWEHVTDTEIQTRCDVENSQGGEQGMGKIGENFGVELDKSQK